MITHKEESPTNEYLSLLYQETDIRMGNLTGESIKQFYSTVKKYVDIADEIRRKEQFTTVECSLVPDGVFIYLESPKENLGDALFKITERCGLPSKIETPDPIASIRGIGTSRHGYNTAREVFRRFGAQLKRKRSWPEIMFEAYVTRE